MKRISFFESIEREIDFQCEYEKIEHIILNEHERGTFTLEEEIEAEFRNWEHRMNYLSFYELRNHLGFGIEKSLGEYIPTGTVNSINGFLLYSEMLLNIFFGMYNAVKNYQNEVRIKAIVETIEFDLEMLNHKIYQSSDDIIKIIQKDVGSMSVADFVEPQLADAVLEYNHYLLRGDLKKKQSILKQISDALEPFRNELKSYNKQLEKDFFYLVNNMNIRHNNCDPSDQKNYSKKFASLSSKEQEKWYDDIYQESLMAFLTLEQVKRTRRIAEYKENER